MIHADLIGGLTARLIGIKNIFWGVHHSVLIYGKVKWPTIFILKINALLSHFIPKKSFTVLKNLDLLKNLLDLVSQKALLFKMDMILKNFIEILTWVLIFVMSLKSQMILL